MKPRNGVRRASRQRIARHFLVMRAVAREAAFEQGEFGHVERLRREAARAFEKACDFARAAAFPAGERDVRVEGAALGFEADLLQRRSTFAASAATGALGSTPAHKAPLLRCSKRPVPPMRSSN